MLNVEYTTKIKRDLKLCKRRNKDLNILRRIMKEIEAEKTLPAKLKDHSLSGNWCGFRELHVEPDWLLIYKLIPEEKTVVFVRSGTHSDLF